MRINLRVNGTWWGRGGWGCSPRMSLGRLTTLRSAWDLELRGLPAALSSS